MRYTLQIKEFEAFVFLGCFPDEQAERRRVIFNISLFLRNAPVGCTSDLHENTICYERLTSVIHEQLQDKRFHLIESLAMYVYKSIKHTIGDYIDISVEAIKPRPTENISEARFIISDL